MKFNSSVGVFALLVALFPFACLAAWQSSSAAGTIAFSEPAATVQWPIFSFIHSALSRLLADDTTRQPSSKRIRLANVFHQGTRSYRGLSARYDFAPTEDAITTSLANGVLRTKRVKTWKPKDISPFVQAHSEGDSEKVFRASRSTEWDEIEVEGPDVSDRQTLLTLAKMASEAYIPPKNGSDKGWVVDGSGKWNLSESFGWVEDGIRGHIFGTEDNSTIVVALKGTSAALLDDGATSKRDKVNDNLFFSCCCAHVGWTWHTVCDCFQDGLTQQTCSSSCLTKALIEKSFYYPATTDLFNNISYAYPDAQIWITGHSLGGALAALIGMTFGYPVVTFEAPAERMAALRLHLPLPTYHKGKLDALPITHVYHTGDPIPMGECVGTVSLCANFGYAMESRCHSGKTVLYDTVGKLGWPSTVEKHRISTLIDEILDEDWNKKLEKGKLKSLPDAHLSKWRLPWRRSDDESDKPAEGKPNLAVPRLRSEQDCVDCSDWKFTSE